MLILNDLGVITSISLCPNPAPPQLYSIAVDEPSSFSTLELHVLARCSKRARDAISETHWRTGALTPGAPRISQRPGCV